MNICGCLLQIRPGLAEATVALIERMAGVEVHARDADGRLVVVVEDTPGMRADERLMTLHKLPGVVSLTLSFHHFDPTDDIAAA